MPAIEVAPGYFLDKLQPGDGIAAFDCGHQEVNGFLKQNAFDDVSKGLSITYVIKDRNAGVVSYISLCMGSLKIEDPGCRFKSQPGLLIGQLGTDEKHKIGRGGKKFYFGHILVRFALYKALELKKEIGCRFLFVHAYPDVVKYYRKLGFETEFDDPKGMETVPMYLRLDAPG